MSLGNLAENIDNGNVSLDAAKQEKRVMENMLEIFMQGNFTKDEEKFSLLLKKICFHCLNDVFGKNKWKEKYLGNEKLMPETFKLSF